MGSNKSKFYDGFSSDSYAAILIGERGPDVVFGDDSLRKAVKRATAKNMEDPEKKVHTSYHCSVHGDFKESAGGGQKTLRLLHLLADILEHAHLAGWCLVTCCNLDEKSTYGQRWIMKKKDKFDLESPVCLNPIGPNKLYFCCDKPERTKMAMKIIRDMSTKKGIKETFRYGDVNGVKLTLRHCPFEPDLYDWWGGAYLIVKLIERISVAGFSIVFQGSTITNEAPIVNVGLVIAKGERTLKFRRFPKETTETFKKDILQVWDEGLEDTAQDNMGYSVDFKGSPFEDPKILLALFESLHRQGFEYRGGFRAQIDDKATSAMLFADCHTGNPISGRLAAFQLRGSNGVTFCNLEESEIEALRNVLSEKSHGGIKDEEPGVHVTLNGRPWNEPIYSQILICQMLEAMEKQRFELLAAVVMGKIGDIFVFKHE